MELFQQGTTLKAKQQFAAAADAFGRAREAGHDEPGECHFQAYYSSGRACH